MLLRSANFLIYIYLIFCGCILVFDLATLALQKRREHVGQRQRRIWARVLDHIRSFELTGGGAERRRLAHSLRRLMPLRARLLSPVDDLDGALYHALRRLPCLVAFQEELESQLKTDPLWAQLLSFIQARRNVFARLGEHYLEKEPMVRAYFAWVVRKYRLGGPEPEDPMARALLPMTVSNSIYSRENALQALYSFGGVENVLRAYRQMSLAGIQHSPKLVTDGLLAFAGDQGALADTLWNAFGEFPPGYQIAFVNFFRLSNGGYGARLLPLLDEPGTDRELRIALLRYFRRYPYGPARPVLQAFLSPQGGEAGWEFGAVAALSLSAYPGPDTEQALMRGLSHWNWYVRANAAEAFLSLRAKAARKALVGALRRKGEAVLPLLKSESRPSLALKLAAGLRGKGWYVRLDQGGRLCAIPADDPALRAVLDGTDGFARDMLRYKLEAFALLGE